MIKGVLFDLDGVITDTARYHFEAWKRLAKEYFMCDLADDVNDHVKGVSRFDSLEIVLKAAGLQDWYTITGKNALATLKNNYYKEMIQTITANDLLDGIDQLLKKTKDKGYKTAIASASHNATFILDKLGVSSYFDAVCDPTGLNGKPAPDIFLKSAEMLSLTPAECVGIEDSYSGIQAINAAKMISVGIGDSSVLKKANFVFENTTYLEKKFFDILKAPKR